MVIRLSSSAGLREPATDPENLHSAGLAGPDDIFTTREAATYLKLSASTLEKARVRGDGPTYAQPTRRVIYRRRDLDDWLDRARRSSTSDQYARPFSSDVSGRRRP